MDEFSPELIPLFLFDCFFTTRYIYVALPNCEVYPIGMFYNLFFPYSIDNMSEYSVLIKQYVTTRNKHIVKQRHG